MTINITIINYGADFYDEQICSTINELQETLKISDHMKWIHIEGFNEKDKIQNVLNLLQLNEKTIENLDDTHEFPKYEIKKDYTSFIINLTRVQENKKNHNNLKNDKVYIVF